jgi:TM2 domain-containing membrane protein YozV
MTDPSQFSSSEAAYSPRQQPPPAGYYADPAAPFGRHPFTGEPYSDKSKIAAGLLQLLGLLGLVGIGRMYLGQIGYGIAQLLVGLVTCGIGAWVWGIIDAILILTDNVRDSQGRPLRE